MTAPTPTPYQQQPMGGGYTSPIPVRSTHLGHALASEWTKIRTVRSTIWTIGVMFVLVVGIGLLVAVQVDDREFVDAPFTIPALFGLLLGQICIITLGVLVVSSEYGTGMIRTTFTASPQRWRVLAAKMIVFFAVSFSALVVAIGLVGAATAGIHSDAGSTSGGDWARGVLGGALYVSLLGLLAVAVGSMLRHSAGAITAMLGVVLLPSIIGPIMGISQSLQAISDKLIEYNAPNSLSALFSIPMSGDEGGNGMKQLALLAVVTAAAMAGSFALLNKRDV
ncbi:ABC transporter permease [Streptomyces beijiangensis]|uniref:ABC transporter permease subunit n=1 Tax=Streptomyces beijiangensis TaxID=163361 RepID=A0A939F8X7_9ACTN|nr:ABC transporter permease subunit [Streptomyces beijiangensis]MBO0514093.1 ABC transporter permease subunit [Streptomyces beijiangensis]